MRQLHLALGLSCVAVGTLLARPGVPPTERLALVNANIVNVATGSVLDGQTLVLTGGRIESIGTAPAPAGVRVLNLGNRWVLPGLIDAHVHIASVAQMRAALQSGVTTARSAGVAAYVDVGLRDLVKRGHLAGPDQSPSPPALLQEPRLRWR